ncbi:MAG: ComF family protein [Bacteroidales bacterium]|nr:ComF family protein [Bacteroidales bacterium]
MKNVLEGLKAAADILLPRVCIVCGRKLHLKERHICLNCQADMPRTWFWEQSHNAMADRFNAAIQHGLEAAWAEAGGPEPAMAEPQGAASGSPHEPYAYAAALFFYNEEAGYRHIPYQIKYHGNMSAGRHFGQIFGRYLASSALFSNVDIIIPVPLHWTRKWKRGYNQAEVIASAVAEAMARPLRTDILMRSRRTRTQTKLDIKGKARNVSGAFKVSRRHILTEMPVHILVIDDVFTTGSTLMACFTALRAVFPSSVRISVATLGFVGDV